MKDKRRSRLARLQRSGELAPARPSKSPPKKSVPGECFLFPGEESVAQTATGNCYLREVSVPLQQRHGCYTLAEGLNCNGSDLSLPARDRSLSPVDPALPFPRRRDHGAFRRHRYLGLPHRPGLAGGRFFPHSTVFFTPSCRGGGDAAPFCRICCFFQLPGYI